MKWSILTVSALLLSGGCGGNRTTVGDNGDMAVAVSPSDMTLLSSGTLTISPPSALVTVQTGQSLPTEQFQALLDGQPISATWSISRGEIGSVDGTGLFSTVGQTGGTASINAMVQGQKAVAQITVDVIRTENGDPSFATVGPPGVGGYGGVGGDGPGGVATSQQTATLQGTATTDATVKMLYPYDGTVFPRGLLAPLLMWNPGTHQFDSLRLKMTSKSGSFSYDGYFSKPTNGSVFQNLLIPQATWDSMTYTAAGDQVTVTITFAEGSVAYALPSFKWVIANGTLHGIVYYQSYGTSLAQNLNQPAQNGTRFGGATLGIKPGATAPVLAAGHTSSDDSGCRVCHSVASGGSRLMTQDGVNYNETHLIALSNNNTETTLGAGQSAFPAIFPDGSRFFTNTTMMWPDTSSRLYTLDASGNSTLVSSPPGLDAALHTGWPSFAPNGRLLAFNFYSGVSGADGASLAIMPFDPTSNSFGTITKIFTPSTFDPSTLNGWISVWPSFLPTSSALIFETELSNGNPYSAGRTDVSTHGRLYWSDLGTQTAHALDKLNGTGYLPTNSNHPDDTTLNYEPTVDPVASGGYAWIVFTSRRIYGNVATMTPFLSDPRNYDNATNITTKKLWAAAFDLNAQPGSDGSHPAFYIPGQELYAGNSRGFWTALPCQANGQSCQSGDECCGGYCEQSSNGALECAPSTAQCGKESDRCATDSDCCPPSIDTDNETLHCVNSYCVTTSPPIF